MFLNIHSHYASEPAGVRAIQNVIIPSAKKDDEVLSAGYSGKWISAGIHPWNISQINYTSQLSTLADLAGKESVKMIGECGLDRLRGPSLDLQLRVFEDQIYLAEKLKKPVIVHCVKCFSELLMIKKKLNPAVPLIVHGFNNKIETARQLLMHDFYLSFGAAVLSEGSNAEKVASEVPETRIFLETDDRDIPVERVYERVALLKNVSVNRLEEIIFANYQNLGNSFNLL